MRHERVLEQKNASTKNAITKKDVLQKYYDMACHNLMCYSKNLLMSEPKPGYEDEWSKAMQECEILKSMLKPLE